MCNNLIFLWSSIQSVKPLVRICRSQIANFSISHNFGFCILDVKINLQKIPESFINFDPTETHLVLDTNRYTKKYSLKYVQMLICSVPICLSNLLFPNLSFSYVINSDHIFLIFVLFQEFIFIFIFIYINISIQYAIPWWSPCEY